MPKVGWIDTETVDRRMEKLIKSFGDDMSVGNIEIIGEKVRSAYYDILSVLTGRGFTKAQVDTWANRVEFQRDIAVYESLAAFGYPKGDEQDWISIFNKMTKIMTKEDDGDEMALVTEDGIKIEPASTGDSMYQQINIEQINEDREISLP